MPQLMLLLNAQRTQSCLELEFLKYFTKQLIRAILLLLWALNCSQHKLPNARESKKKRLFLGKYKWSSHSGIRVFLCFAKHLSKLKSFEVVVLSTRLRCGLLIIHGICSSCELNNRLCLILTCKRLCDHNKQCFHLLHNCLVIGATSWP